MGPGLKTWRFFGALNTSHREPLGCHVVFLLVLFIFTGGLQKTVFCYHTKSRDDFFGGFLSVPCDTQRRELGALASGNDRPILDCYWLGSLDFNFWGNGGVSHQTTKKLNFLQGGQQQPSRNS